MCGVCGGNMVPFKYMGSRRNRYQWHICGGNGRQQMVAALGLRCTLAQEKLLFCHSVNSRYVETFKNNNAYLQAVRKVHKVHYRIGGKEECKAFGLLFYENINLKVN